MLTIKALTDSRLRHRAQLKDAETQRNSDAKYVLYFLRDMIFVVQHIVQRTVDRKSRSTGIKLIFLCW